MAVARQLSMYEGPVCAILGPLDDESLSSSISYMTERSVSAPGEVVELRLCAQAISNNSQSDLREPMAAVHYLPKEAPDFSDSDLSISLDGVASNIVERQDALEALVSIYNRANKHRGYGSALENDKAKPKKGSKDEAVKAAYQTVSALEEEATQLINQQLARISELRAAGFDENDIQRMAAIMHTKLYNEIGSHVGVTATQRKKFAEKLLGSKQSQKAHSTRTNDIPF